MYSSYNFSLEMAPFFIFTDVLKLLLIILCSSLISVATVHADDKAKRQHEASKRDLTNIEFKYPNCTEGTFADSLPEVCSPCSSQCLENDDYPFAITCCAELQKCHRNAAGKIIIKILLNKKK